MQTPDTKVENILNQIKQLDYSGRMDILEKVIMLLKQEPVTKEQVNISSISGLGSEIWKYVDLDKYLADERQWD